MRYVAKVHVLDVMDEVVVSGYVYDADPLTDPDHTPLEFSFTAQGVGLSDPYAWLLNSLYRCLVGQHNAPREGAGGALADVGSHTVSETGDTV